MTEGERDPRSGGPQNNEKTRLGYLTFEAVAEDLGIPSEKWAEPAVQYFIEVNRQVRTLKLLLEERTYPPDGGKSRGPQETPSLDARYYAISKLARVSEI